MFERTEPIRSYPKDQPGAAKHLEALPWLEVLPGKGDPKRVNVLEGLELHEAVMTPQEEGALVSTYSLALRSY